MSVVSTPRPWKMSPRPSRTQSGHVVAFNLLGSNDHYLGALDFSTASGARFPTREEAEANAALIVEAVNNHDQLREDNVILKQLAGEGAQKIEELRAEHAEMVEFLKGLDHTPPKGVTFKQFVRGGAGRLLARLDRAK